jgi:NAD(P)-dependent dehydrogenase (short-subunit alcohol dehydrogenase family)
MYGGTTFSVRSQSSLRESADTLPLENKVVFCTGGAGTICSVQVRAMVHLGADACILGRNVEKTESMAKDIATARLGTRVIGIGNTFGLYAGEQVLSR